MRRGESQGFLVINPTNSVVLQSSYLPLIRFDLSPMDKGGVQKEWGRGERETEGKKKGRERKRQGSEIMRR